MLPHGISLQLILRLDFRRLTDIGHVNPCWVVSVFLGAAEEVPWVYTKEPCRSEERVVVRGDTDAPSRDEPSGEEPLVKGPVFISPWTVMRI